MLICIINFSVSKTNRRLFFVLNHHLMFPTKSREPKNFLSTDLSITKRIKMSHTAFATICHKIEVCHLKRWIFTEEIGLKTPYLHTKHITQSANTSAVNRKICKFRKTKNLRIPGPQCLFLYSAKKHYQDVESQISQGNHFFAIPLHRIHYQCLSQNPM